MSLIDTFFAILSTQKKAGDRAEDGRPHGDSQDMLNMNVKPLESKESTPLFPVEGSRRSRPRTYVESKVEVVSPEAARSLRDTAHFERQRNISPQNVSRLAAAMEAGQFVPGTQVYICTLPSGRELIVNGNHTLEAVATCGIAQALTITRKVVRDENEAGEIYATFDIQKVRSWRDSMRAIGADDDLPMAETVLSAVRFINNRFSAKTDVTTSRVDQIARVEEYRVAAHQWSDALYGGTLNSRRLLRRASVAAIALVSFRYQPSLAHEFWGRIAHDNGLTNDMPEKALLNWLRNVRNSSGGASRVEHAKAAALAWNAAWRGDKRAYIKPGLMTAFFMLGTPYASGLGEQ